jgi:hypothetical protein
MPHPPRQVVATIRHFVLAFVAAAGLSAGLAASAQAVVLASQPSADVRPGTSIEDVVARGADNHVYYKSFDGSQWLGWTDLGGPAIGRPTVISYGANHVDVYVRDANRRLMHRWWDGSSWRPWESIGGAWQLAGDPAVLSWAPGRVDAFARGDDGSMIHTWFNGSGWASWETLGGYITTDPTPVSLASGHLDIFALGTSGLLYHKVFNNSAWSNWIQIGAWQYTNRPGASTWNNGSAYQINAYARGTNGALDEAYWLSSTGNWIADSTLGGNIAGTPATASMQYGHLDLFARSGVDATLYNKSCCYSFGWTGWVQHGTLAMGSDPTAIGWSGHMDVFALDQGGGLIHQAYYSSAWHAWDYLSVPGGSDPWPTSTQYGGYDRSVNTQAEADRVAAAEDGIVDPARTALWAGLSPADQAQYPSLDPNVRYFEADDGAMPWIYSDPADSDTPIATAAAGTTAVARAPHNWCAGGIVGVAYGGSPIKKYKFMQLGYLGPKIYRVALSATTYDCGNGYSRMYFGWWWDATAIPSGVDASTPTYQWQMYRFNNNQAEVYLDGILKSLQAGTKSTGVLSFEDLPYKEMKPPPDHSAAGRMKEARLVIGFAPTQTDPGVISAPHTVKIPMHYATNLRQP